MVYADGRLTSGKKWSAVAAFLCMAVGLVGCTANESAPVKGDVVNAESETTMPGFAQLKAKAEAGERLDVVFFGGSLTWGANASDPQVTSYRALVAQRMLDLFPKSQIRFHDAAIGGTGSQLGIYRLDRDVLAHEPDLVFLDFTANDDIRDAEPTKLASYESLARRIIGDGDAPLVIMIFPFRGDAEQGSTKDMPGRDATLRIAEAYNVPVGDAVVEMQRRLAAGEFTAKEIWPWDGAHPCDRGYAVFADAAMTALQHGLDRGTAMRLPSPPLHGDACKHVARVELASFGETLPDGWRADTPSRVAAWYDGLMCRWLDSVVVARGKPAPLRLTFQGGTVGVFGEEVVNGGQYRVRIDGKPVLAPKEAELFNTSAKRFGGNRQHFAILARGLDASKEHTLSIEPVLEADQQVRIESICVAGPQPPKVGMQGK